jgi:hypothetical protein
MASSDLKNILSRSYSSSNLLEIQLMKDEDDKLPFYKDKFFVFIGFAPGNISNGKRTYDIKSKMVMKVDLFKVLALAKSIQALASAKTKEEEAKSNYTIFTDSGGGKKTLSTMIYYPQKKEGQIKEPDELFILAMKFGEKKCNFSCNKFDALALAEEISELTAIGREKSNQVKMTQQNNYKSNYGNSDPSGASNSLSNEIDLPTDEDLPF